MKTYKKHTNKKLTSKKLTNKKRLVKGKKRSNKKRLVKSKKQHIKFNLKGGVLPETINSFTDELITHITEKTGIVSDERLKYLQTNFNKIFTKHIGWKLLKNILEEAICRQDSYYNKSKCGTGTYKTVFICNETAEEEKDESCKYVYAFDFITPENIDSDGENRFETDAKYEELKPHNDLLFHIPKVFQKIIIEFPHEYKQRIDFMVLQNNGMDLFDEINKDKLYKYNIPNIDSIIHKKLYNRLWLAFSILLTALYSISIMHHNQFTHRDIKPENILMGHPKYENSYITLTDYGFIRKYTESDVYKLEGTPEYMTKQYVNDSITFAKCMEYDLHAIGCTITVILFNINIGFQYKDRREYKSILSKDEDGTYGTFKELYIIYDEDNEEYKYESEYKILTDYVSEVSEIDDNEIKYNDPKKLEDIIFPKKLYEIMIYTVKILLHHGFTTILSETDFREATELYKDMCNNIKNELDTTIINYIKKIIEQNKLPFKINPIILTDFFNKIAE